MDLSDETLPIIGLGYVGLPLPVEFGRRRPVSGFDVNLKAKELHFSIDAVSSSTPHVLCNQIRS